MQFLLRQQDMANSRGRECCLHTNQCTKDRKKSERAAHDTPNKPSNSRWATHILNPRCKVLSRSRGEHHCCWGTNRVQHPPHSRLQGRKRIKTACLELRFPCRSMFQGPLCLRVAMSSPYGGLPRATSSHTACCLCSATHRPVFQEKTYSV